MTELLWASYFLMTIFCYYIFQKDLTAPSFLFCGMYLFSITMALISKEEWQVSISDETFVVFFLGGWVFIGLGLLFRARYGGSAHMYHTGKLSVIEMPDIITCLVILFAAISAYLQYRANMEIAAQIGVSGSSALVTAAIRQAVSYGTDISIPSYIVQMNKVLSVLAYTWLFIYINNGVISARNWRKILMLLPVIIFLASNLIVGNRLLILYIAGASFVYYYILLTFHRGNNVDSGKILRIAMLGFAVLMLAFYGIRLLAGRVGSEQTALLQYISLYAGGPIKLFDMFLDAPVASDLWGKETFIPIHKTLQAWGLEDYPAYLAHKEFREVNGVGVGNVYTAYRAWYADFGFAGIAVLGSFLAAFYNWFYYKLRFSRLHECRFALLVYGYMSSGLFLHSIDDVFYPYFASLGFVSILVIFYLCYSLFIKRRSRQNA